MLSPPYDIQQVRSLRLLLHSIAAEVAEREHALSRLADRRRELGPGLQEPEERRLVTMEMASHLREIRRAKTELRRLGCTIQGRAPLTLGVPTLLHGRVFRSLWSLEELQDPRDGESSGDLPSSPEAPRLEDARPALRP